MQSPSPPRIVVLSVHNNEGYVVEALRHGAVGLRAEGVRLGGADSGDPRSRRRAPVHRPRHFAAFPSGVSAEECKGRRTTRWKRSRAREREVFQLTAEGNSGVDVAERLFISPRTVETHRANVLRKLGLRNHKELIRYAAQRGMLPARQGAAGRGKGL